MMSGCEKERDHSDHVVVTDDQLYGQHEIPAGNDGRMMCSPVASSLFMVFMIIMISIKHESD